MADNKDASNAADPPVLNYADPDLGRMIVIARFGDGSRIRGRESLI